MISLPELSIRRQKLRDSLRIIKFIDALNINGNLHKKHLVFYRRYEVLLLAVCVGSDRNFKVATLIITRGNNTDTPNSLEVYLSFH